MDSPIQKCLQAWKLRNEYVTRFVTFGGRVEAIKMRLVAWEYLEQLQFYGYNTEKLLLDCAKACEGNELGNTLDWWLYWIANREHEEKGIPLEHNSDNDHRPLN